MNHTVTPASIADSFRIACLDNNSVEELHLALEQFNSGDYSAADYDIQDSVQFDDEGQLVRMSRAWWRWAIVEALEEKRTWATA